MSQVAWTQWTDLDVPDGVEYLRRPLEEVTDDEWQRVTFYVPPYLQGRRTLELTRRMPRLRVLQLPNAGYDDATPYLRPGMALCNARGVHDESTAELAVALALAGRRGFAEFGYQAQQQLWRSQQHPSLTDSRIAVVGHGSIGRTIMRMLGGFSVTVDAFSRRGTDGAQPVAMLPERIGDYDIVILVLPLTAASEHLFDADMLARMRDGALLVNVARGRIVDTDALVAELRAGRLRAALDVTDPEPLPADHPLWSAPGCWITPHVGGNTTAFAPRMRTLIETQLGRLVRGEELVNVVMDRRSDA